MTAAEQRKKKAQQMADYYAARGDSTSAGAKAAQRAVSKAEGKTPYSASAAAVQKYRANKPTTVQDLYANRTTRQNNQTQAPNPALARQIANTVLGTGGGRSAIAGVDNTIRSGPANPVLAQKIVEQVSNQQIRIQPGAASDASTRQQMEAAQTKELGNVERTGTLARIGKSALSGVKDWAAGYMDYAAAGTAAENRAGTDLTRSALAGYKQQLENERAVMASYERGEGLYDKKDYDVAREQAENLQRYIDAYDKALGANEEISGQTAAESEKLKQSAAMDSEEATSGLGKVGTYLIRGVGTTVQNLLDSAVGGFGQRASFPSIAARVYGQSTQNALNDGKSREGAVRYGLAQAAAELAPELFFSGNPLTDAAGGGLVSEAADSLLSGSKAKKLRDVLGTIGESKYVNNFLTKLGADAFGEGVEEVITQGLNDIIDRITYGDEKDLSTPQDYAEAFWGGVIGSLYGNALRPAGVINNARDDVAGLRQQTAQSNVDGVIDRLAQSTGDNPEALRNIIAPVWQNEQRLINNLAVYYASERGLAPADAASVAQSSATRFYSDLASTQQTTGQPIQQATQQVAQEAAQQASAPTDAGIAPEAENAPSGVFNTAQDAQEAKPAQTVADIYANRTTRQQNIDNAAQAADISSPTPVDAAASETNQPVSGVSEMDTHVADDSVTQEGQAVKPSTLEESIENFNRMSDEFGERLRQIQEESRTREIREDEVKWLEARGNWLNDEKQRIVGLQRQAQGVASKNRGTAENHIDNRDWGSMRKPSIKSFQFDHPELHKYYAQMAERLRDTIGIAMDGDIVVKTRNGGYINKAEVPDVIRGLVNSGATREQIMTACEHIINDEGQENYALAKRVEILLDKLLTNGSGFEKLYGNEGFARVEPNSEYIAQKAAIEGGSTEAEIRARQDAEADEFVRMVEGDEWVDALEGKQSNTTAADGRDMGKSRAEVERENQALKDELERDARRGIAWAPTDSRLWRMWELSDWLTEHPEADARYVPETAADGRDMGEGSLFDATKGPGAGATREGPQVPSQNNLTRDMNLSEEGRKAVAESTTTHEQISDKLANARADAQIIRGPDGSWVNLQDSMNDLRQTMAERGVLTPEQVKLAEKVMVELDRRAGESNNWDEARAFNRDVIRPSKTGAAQSLRAWEEFSGGSVDVVSTAMEILESAKPNPNTNTNKRRTANEADRLLQRVSREVTKAEDAVFEQFGLDDFFSTPTEPAADIPKLRDIITKSWQTKQKVYDDILNYYVSKYGMSEQEAGLAANNIATQFYDELARFSDSALHRAFDKKTKREEKPWLDRAVELINLGALTSEDFQSVASQKLFGGTVDNAVLTQISEYAERAQDLREAKNIDGLRDLVVEIAAARGYKPGKGINKIIRERMTADQLYEVAQTSAAAIAVDKIKPTTAEKLSTWLYLSHLYNTRTIIRNVAANVEFSPLDRAANNIGIIPDFIFSMIRTAAEGGTVSQNRTVGYQPSMWARTEGAKEARAIRRGYVDQARVDNALDINRNAAEGKYSQKNEKITNRTYKRNGTGEGKLDKVWNRFNNFREGALGWGLNVTDAMQKGKTKGQSEVAMKRLKEHGSRISDAAAERITEDDMLYRSFQRDTPVGTGLATLREAANSVGIGEKNGRFFETTHEFGLGNMTGNYTQVPGALLHTVLDYTPAGVVNTTMELANAIKTAMGEQEAEVKRGKYKGMTNADASIVAQHNAAVSLARSLTGSGIMALFAALSKAGVVWYEPYGGDDKDKDETKAAQGRGGLQVNLSGLVRLASGQDTSVRGDDIIYDFGSSPPLSALATAGVLLADEDDDDVFMRTINATAKSVGEMITDLSMMNTAKTIADDIKYRGDKNAAEVLGDIAGDIAADSISGFIPGTIRQIAKVSDDTMRDTSADTVQERVWNRFRNANPILRETLPAKVDYKGEERTYAGNALTRGLNTFLLPGDVTIYQQDEVVDYIDRVAEETGKSLYAAAYAPKSFTVKDADGNEHTVALNTDARRAYDEQYKGTYYAALDGLMNAGYADELSYEQVAEIGRELRSLAADSAKRLYCEQNGIEYSSSYDKYQNIEDPALYMAMKESLKQLRNSNGTDSEAFDAVYSQWKGLSQAEKKKYTEGIDGEFSGIDTLKKLDACIRGGMSTEQFFKAKNVHDEIDDLDLKAAEKRARFANWLDTQSRFTTAEKRTALANFPYTTTLVADEGNYEKMTEAGVSEDGSLALFNAMQKLEPAEGYTDVAGWQKNEAITSSGLTDEEQLAALSVYATDSAYDYYQTAYDYGIAPSKWSEVLANMRGYEGTLKSDGKTNSGALSQENLLRAMQDAGLSDQKQRAMYATYAAKKGWTTGYDDARGNINWRYYGY